MRRGNIFDIRHLISTFQPKSRHRQCRECACHTLQQGYDACAYLDPVLRRVAIPLSPVDGRLEGQQSYSRGNSDHGAPAFGRGLFRGCMLQLLPLPMGWLSRASPRPHPAATRPGAFSLFLFALPPISRGRIIPAQTSPRVAWVVPGSQSGPLSERGTTQRSSTAPAFGRGLFSCDSTMAKQPLRDSNAVNSTNNIKFL